MTGYKRIFAVGVGLHADERRVVLLLERQTALVSKRAGLDEQAAELFAEGVLEGLRVAALGYTLQEPSFDGEMSPSWNVEEHPAH